MKILAFMSDAYGGHGGIAQFNRDMFDALSSAEQVRHIVSLTRNPSAASLPLPPKYEELSSPGNPLRYSLLAIRQSVKFRPDAIICGHINLLPVAAVVKRITRARLVLIAHGIEAWERGGRIRSQAIKQVDTVLTVSRYTRARLLTWSDLEPHKVKVIFNTIHLENYKRGEKPAHLVERYGVSGRRVLLTVSRLSASEKYKGHDKIIAALPELLKTFPDLIYLIVGDGDDRRRLEASTARSGVQDRVVFAGRVAEEEKVEHYNLADAFAMPSTGEGFGIVFLEAAACGLPVLGGSQDGSRDALCEGALGVIVNPDKPSELLKGLEEILRRERGIPARLHTFSFTHFSAYLERLLMDGIDASRCKSLSAPTCQID